MPRAHITTALRRRVIADSHHRCAYCYTPTLITGAPLVIDHIIPQVAGGQSEWGNLCVACHSCNEFKGAQTHARDPLTGKHLPLFHPRRQDWREHFRWSEDASEIIGLTPTGRATIVALNMNHFQIAQARRRWALVGWHPPQEDV